MLCLLLNIGIVIFINFINKVLKFLIVLHFSLLGRKFFPEIPVFMW